MRILSSRHVLFAVLSIPITASIINVAVKEACMTRIVILMAMATAAVSEIRAQQPADNRVEAFVSRFTYDLRTHSNLSHYETQRCGSLSVDGKNLLINDFKNCKLVLINVDSVKQETLSTDPRIFSAWFDSQIGAVFILKLRTDVKISEHRSIIFPKDFDAVRGFDLVDLHCFDSLADLRNEKPSWVRPNVCRNYSAIHWIGSHNVFVIHECPPTGNLGNTRITILSKNGHEIGQFEIPGQFIGVDSGEEDVEIFHIAGSGNNQEVRVSFVGSTLNRVKRKQVLYPLPWRRVSLLPLLCWEDGSRGFRLREQKQGDVRKFITQVMPQPGYWKYNDVTSLLFTLGRNPLAQLSQVQFQLLTSDGTRFVNLGKLDAMESAQAFEIVRNNGSNSPGFLLNHLGQVIPTVNFSVLDAVISKERSVIVSSKTWQSKIPDTNRQETVTTISLLTLDQNAMKETGK